MLRSTRIRRFAPGKLADCGQMVGSPAGEPAAMHSETGSLRPRMSEDPIQIKDGAKRGKAAPAVLRGKSPGDVPHRNAATWHHFVDVSEQDRRRPGHRAGIERLEDSGDLPAPFGGPEAEMGGQDADASFG